MTDEWMIDVLADLRAFAGSNALPSLAEHLDDAMLVAAAELAAREEGRTRSLRVPPLNDVDLGRLPRADRIRQNA